MARTQTSSNTGGLGDSIGIAGTMSRPHGFEQALMALKLFDILVLLVALTIAGMITATESRDGVFALLQRRLATNNLSFLLFFSFVWHSLFAMSMLYTEDALYKREGRDKSIVKATIFGTMLLAMFSAILRFEIVNTEFLVTFWLISVLLCSLVRKMISFALLQGPTAEVHRKHVLIVGTNDRAMEFAKTILDRPELGYTILGFVDDQWQVEPPTQNGPYRLPCGIAHLRDYLRTHVVDEVVACLPIKSQYDAMQLVVAACEEHGVPLSISTQLFSIKNPRLRQRFFRDALILTISSSLTDERTMIVKRLIDICGSACILLAASPILILTAVLIKLTSKGPVLFAQERVGLNKRTFKMFKFRTMVTNAEELQKELEHLNEAKGGHFKIRKDPRITPIGRILRKLSIDEFPQLFNVLKGDMSLVGPRPLPLRDYGGMKQEWPRRRFGVRPGVTCLWQIEGRADPSISFEQWMELDMKYVDSWSLWLDIVILLRTIPAVLRGSGAY